MPKTDSPTLLHAGSKHFCEIPPPSHIMNPVTGLATCPSPSNAMGGKSKAKPPNFPQTWARMRSPSLKFGSNTGFRFESTDRLLPFLQFSLQSKHYPLNVWVCFHYYCQFQDQKSKGKYTQGHLGTLVRSVIWKLLRELPELCELLSVPLIQFHWYSSMDTVVATGVAKGGVSAYIRDPVQQTLPSVPFHYWGNAG